MAETLRRLVSMASFSVLQEKMENWLTDYSVNTCDQNVNRCIEIIELNARLQSQLVRLLSLTAAEGGVYGGAAVIKSRLLPWLSSYGTASLGSAVDDAALNALTDAAAKDRQLKTVQDIYEKSLESVEADLSATKAEADQLKLQLEVKEGQLTRERRKSASEKIFTETEVSELRNKLQSLEDELDLMRTQAGRASLYERQISRLKDEVALLNTQKDALLDDDLQDDDIDLPAASPSRLRSLSPVTSSFTDLLPSQRYRQQKLITRFNEMSSRDRLDAMNILRRSSDGDHENNQRIVFAAIQEAFRTTRLAFNNYKNKIRSALVVTHTGPETLEEAVQDYINRNAELFDTAELVTDVVRGLNRQPDLYLSPGLSFVILHSFIRESCKLAWSMFALPRPLDIAPAANLELLDETRYRRSYDSDFSAPLVSYHIWPCLMQGLRVVMKGEVYAVRGSSAIRSRSRSPVRSPVRSRSSSPSRVGRSRSPLRSGRV